MVKEIAGWVGTILVAILIAAVINIFVFQPHQVSGPSMEPTLKDGNFGIISKIPHTFGSEPKYNDIVVIDSRVNRKHTIKDDVLDSLEYNVIARALFNKVNKNYWVKRVVGKAGDELEIKDGKLYRNGKLLDETYLKEPMKNAGDKKFKVPPGQIFVMGDNRNHSLDSRIIGCVPIENVMGKLVLNF